MVKLVLRVAGKFKCEIAIVDPSLSDLQKFSMLVEMFHDAPHTVTNDSNEYDEYDLLNDSIALSLLPPPPGVSDRAALFIDRLVPTSSYADCIKRLVEATGIEPHKAADACFAAAQGVRVCLLTGNRGTLDLLANKLSYEGFGAVVSDAP